MEQLLAMHKNYRICTEKETVDNIKAILKRDNISVTEEWFNDTEGLYSLQVLVDGTNLYANGKGFSYYEALASAYGELMERLQSGYLFRKIVKTPPGKKNDGNLTKLFLKFLNIDENEINTINNSFIQLQNITSQYECIDFYTYKEKEKITIPSIVLDMIYGTNGLGAGNNREEALLQCFCEIIERSTSKAIIECKKNDNRITDITEYFKVHGYMERIPKNIKGDVKVLDLSSIQGLPALGVLLIDKEMHRYIFKISAHPLIQVAFDKVISELFQGRKYSEIKEEMFPIITNVDSSSEANLDRIFAIGIGEYPLWILGSRKNANTISAIWNDYENMNDVSKWNNAIAQTIENMGYRILYCNHSKESFSTNQVIIPNYSEVTRIDTDNIEAQVSFEKAKNIIATGGFTKENILFIIDCFDKMLFGEGETLADILNVPVDYRYSGLDAVNINLFTAMLNLAIQKYDTSSHYMRKYLNYLEINCDDLEIWEYYRRITEVISLKANNYSDQDILTVLGNFYGVKSIEEALDDIKEEHLFDNLPRFYCQDIFYKRECCNKCTFKDNCYYDYINSLCSQLDADKQVYMLE